MTSARSGPTGGVPEVLTDLSAEGLVRAVEEHQRAQAAMSTLLRGGEIDDGPDMLLYVSGRAVDFTNGVVGARLSPERADARIEEAIAVFRKWGLPMIWWVGPKSRPPDLGERLEAHGLRREEPLAWMAADLAPMPGDVPARAGLLVERVAGAAAQERWLRAMTEGFGLDPEVRESLAELAERIGYGPEAPWIRFVGVLDGELVASAGLVVAGGVAGIYNVSTRHRMRRRGIGTAMTLAAMRQARSLGYRIAVLGTSPLGRGVYEGLGFREVCTMVPYLWRGVRGAT